MRVAYVCADPGIPVWGNKGCSIHVQEVLRAFVRGNIELDLIATRLGGDRPNGLESVPLHLIDDELPGEPGAREQVREGLNLSVSELLAALGPFDFIYERYALWSYAGVEFAQRAGIPGLLEVNAPLVEEQIKHRVLIDQQGAVAATRRALNAATAVLAVSDEVANYVRSLGVVSDRIEVLINAVNPDDFSDCARRRATTTDGEFTIGFVGSLRPWHGVDRLIAAYERICARESAWRLIIAGDGPERERLESMVRAMPARIASSVEFLGTVPHDKIPKLLSTFNVALAPGVPGETYFSPMKVFEYMAAGSPIVAARLGQMPSLIDHGATGLLYNPDDIDDLVGSLLCLRANPELAARMGQQARRKVCARHTWDQRRESIMHIVRHRAQKQAQEAS